MNLSIALTAGLVFALLLLRQYALVCRARRSTGSVLPATAPVRNGICFFHARHCGPCQAIKPLVERLRVAHPNLVAVEVSDDPTLARAVGIAATPSFIAVRDVRVKEVRLGAVSEAWLRQHLTGH
jgi:thioredoxin-like negative regulator of GroEL